MSNSQPAQPYAFDRTCKWCVRVRVRAHVCVCVSRQCARSFWEEWDPDNDCYYSHKNHNEKKMGKR